MKRRKPYWIKRFDQRGRGSILRAILHAGAGGASCGSAGGVRRNNKRPHFLHDIETSRTEFGPIWDETLQHSVEQILTTPKPWIERAKIILE
jgi:hypothetical protein